MVVVVVVVMVAAKRVESAQLLVLRHIYQERPALLRRQAHDVDDLLHLIPLKWNSLFRVHLRLFPFENWPQRQELCEDAPNRPHVDCGCIVARAKKKLRSPVPDGDDHLVAREQRVEGFVEQACQPQVADLDLAARSHHDIGGLEIPVEDPISVQILATIKQLEHDAFDSSRWDRMPRLLCVIVDDLQEVMLCVFEHHIDAFVL